VNWLEFSFTGAGIHGAFDVWNSTGGTGARSLTNSTQELVPFEPGEEGRAAGACGPVSWLLRHGKSDKARVPAILFPRAPGFGLPSLNITLVSPTASGRRWGSPASPCRGCRGIEQLGARFIAADLWAASTPRITHDSSPFHSTTPCRGSQTLMELTLGAVCIPRQRPVKPAANEQPDMRILALLAIGAFTAVARCAAAGLTRRMGPARWPGTSIVRPPSKVACFHA